MKQSPRPPKRTGRCCSRGSGEVRARTHPPTVAASGRRRLRVRATRAAAGGGVSWLVEHHGHGERDEAEDEQRVEHQRRRAWTLLVASADTSAVNRPQKNWSQSPSDACQTVNTREPTKRTA